jgi:hypothetical protein
MATAPTSAETGHDLKKLTSEYDVRKQVKYYAMITTETRFIPQ